MKEVKKYRINHRCQEPYMALADVQTIIFITRDKQFVET